MPLFIGNIQCTPFHGVDMYTRTLFTCVVFTLGRLARFGYIKLHCTRRLFIYCVRELRDLGVRIFHYQAGERSKTS